MAAVRTLEDVDEALSSFVASARGMAAPPTPEQVAWAATHAALCEPGAEEQLRARAPSDLPSRDEHEQELRRLDAEIHAGEVELRRREIDAPRAEADARLQALAAEAEKPAA